MKIRILGSAIEDLDVAGDFYERQAVGLGAYFIDSLFSDIDSLLLHAGVHSRHFGFYRALSRRFPFAIYYRVNEDSVEVWRVLDCRQNPSKLAEALRRPT